MTREFTDRAGYVWPLDLTDRGTLARLRAEGFDPAAALATDDAAFEAFRGGAPYFRGLLWAAVRPLAEADGVAFPEFYARLGRDFLTPAARTLLVAAAGLTDSDTAREIRADFDAWFARLTAAHAGRLPRAWPFDFEDADVLDMAAERAAVLLELARSFAAGFEALAADVAVVPPDFWRRVRGTLSDAAGEIRDAADLAGRLAAGEHVAG